jgi:hypothetical protein
MYYRLWILRELIVAKGLVTEYDLDSTGICALLVVNCLSSLLAALEQGLWISPTRVLLMEMLLP